MPSRRSNSWRRPAWQSWTGELVKQEQQTPVAGKTFGKEEGGGYLVCGDSAAGPSGQLLESTQAYLAITAVHCDQLSIQHQPVDAICRHTAGVSGLLLVVLELSLLC